MQSSNVVSLLETQSSPEAIASFVKARDIQQEIEILVQADEHALRDGTAKPDSEMLFAAVSSFLRTGGGNMTAADRATFIDGCLDHLEYLPVELVLDALKRAPLRVRFPSELLPWIMSQIEGPWAGQKARLEPLRQILDMLPAR